MQNIKSLYALCGLPFAGKTTVGRRVAQRFGAALISLDDIHKECGHDPGADLDQANWDATSRIALERTRHLLRQGRSVVVDDTFSYRAQRDQLRALAEEEATPFTILFMDVPIAIMDERLVANCKHPVRTHVLPHVIAFVRAQFERPAPDEAVLRFASMEEVEHWLHNSPKGSRTPL